MFLRWSILVSAFFVAWNAHAARGVKPSALNLLHYTNRSQCALDADHPTASTFLILDGYNAGKLGYSANILRKLDPSLGASQAMNEFRLALSRLTLLTIDRLLSRRLPLLPMNIESPTNGPITYLGLVKNCTNKVYCPALDKYLAKIWKIGQSGAIDPTSSQWQAVDTFTNQTFYSGKKQKPTGCFFVKKFSALQGPLYTSEVNQSSLEDLAAAITQSDSYLTDCLSERDNQGLELDSRNAAIQFDLPVDQDNWDQQGFDFWNSLKIYLSWAWRNSPEILSVSPIYGHLFRSLALEESMIFVPNGCRSITRPSCDLDFLSLNSIRDLTRDPNTTSEIAATASNFDREVPNGPEAELLRKGARGVNNDLMNTRSFPSASEWLHTFQSRFIQTRGRTKTRFFDATRFLNVIADSILAKDLNQAVQRMLLEPQSSSLRDEFYYLCTELRLTADPQLDLLRSQIAQTPYQRSLNLYNQSSPRSLIQLFRYFAEVSGSLIPVCNQLEAQHFWDTPDYTLDRSGFLPWSLEFLQQTPTEPKGTTFVPPLSAPPFLAWGKSNQGNDETVICANAAECARKLIASWVDLYAVSLFADAFLPVSSTARSPDLFNPYAELTVCKIYDPWFQTKRSFKRLASDLANTAAFGWNNLPIYVDLDFDPASVVSFNRLMQEGKIHFAPNIDEEKVKAALVADFGFFLGAPCTISISNSENAGFDYYAFEGISVNYCKQLSSHTQRTDSNSDSGSSHSGFSFCGGCALNFVAVAKTAAAATAGSLLHFNPVKLGVYLFQSVARFFSGIRDPLNVPQSYDIDPELVLQTYETYGSIPPDCVDSIKEGRQCRLGAEAQCAARAAKTFAQSYGLRVLSAKVEIAKHWGTSFPPSDTVWIQTDRCRGLLRVATYCWEDSLRLVLDDQAPLSPSCRELLNTLKPSSEGRAL